MNFIGGVGTLGAISPTTFPGRIAVHIGARITAEAEAGDVIVSATVKDLVVGSGLAFVDRGVRTLRGVPGEWRLFAVDNRRRAPVAHSIIRLLGSRRP